MIFHTFSSLKKEKYPENSFRAKGLFADLLILCIKKALK